MSNHPKHQKPMKTSTKVGLLSAAALTLAIGSYAMRDEHSRQKFNTSVQETVTKASDKVSGTPSKFEEVETSPAKIEKSLQALASTDLSKPAKGKITIVTLYKDDCPVCLRMREDILREQTNLQKNESLDVELITVDAKDPEALNAVEKFMPEGFFDGAKTPYSFVLRSDFTVGEGRDKKLYPVIMGRIETKDILKQYVSDITSMSKLDVDNIESVVDYDEK